MKLKDLAGPALIVVSLALGLGIGLLLPRFWPGRDDLDRHWRAVEAYRAYSARGSADSSNSIPPQLPLVSLATLVASDQLEHFDLVLPTVSSKNRAAQRFWMEYCSARPDIVYVSGNPTYTLCLVSGEPPLHLSIWFRPAAGLDVQSMVQKLEALAGEAAGTRPAAEGHK